MFSAKRLSATVCLSCLLVAAFTTITQAQNRALPPAVPGAQDPNVDIRGMSVTERPRPDYDPLGILMGQFIAYPSIGVGGIYNDNIFATDGGEESDYIVDIRPALRIISNWNNHALNIFGSASIRRYQDNGSEDTEDYLIGTNGRLDITRDANLSMGVQFEHLHEERGSPDDANGNSPTEYDLISSRTAYTHRFNRTRIMPSVDFRYFNFEDVGSTMGNINNDDRDRFETEGSLRVDHQVGPNYSVFVRGTVNNRNYKDAVDDNGFDRDSYGIDLVAGVAVDITGLIFGDIYFGYLEQYYDDPAFHDVTGLSAGVDLTWNVTPLTTITGTAVRRVSETTIGGASGFLATRVGLSADHELFRNLLLHAGAYGQWNDYEDSSREDEYYGANFSLEYLVNRYLSAVLGYRLNVRDSNVAGQDYTENVVFARLRGQY